MKLRVLILGAGFGGLELSSVSSEAIGSNLVLAKEKPIALYNWFLLKLQAKKL